MSKWDYQITAKWDEWNADAVCPFCGFTKPDIWHAWFVSVPANIARATTLSYVKKIRLSNYCENCGAHLEEKDE